MRRDHPLFLEDRSLWRRRLGDSARILPVLSLLVVLVPVWLMPATVSGAGGMVWAFVLWTALVVAIWALHRALARADAAIASAEAAARDQAGAAPPHLGPEDGG